MRVDSNSCGDVAEDGAKTAQWAVTECAGPSPNYPECLLG